MSDEGAERPITFLPNYADASFQPYTIAIGQVALTWNSWHEIMGLLFEKVCDSTEDGPHLAIWHSSKSDRAQREMLEAAAKKMFGHKIGHPQECLKDIKWMLGMANELEEARNNALHSPLVPIGEVGSARVVPSYYLGHVRARKLILKGDVLRELRWFRDTVMILRRYTSHMFAALHGKTPWPDKPRLPNRGETSGKKPRRPKSAAKRSPPPRSSQE